MTSRMGVLAIAACAVLGLSACSGSGGGSTAPPSGSGTFRVVATDAPFTTSNVTAAAVSVSRVEITADGTGASGFVTLSSGATLTLDLFALRNGVTKTLVAATLTAGTYRQLRLTVSDATLTTISPSATYSMGAGNLTVPSGQLVINIDPPVTVTTGLSATTLLLDFVMGNVFVPQGPRDNPNSFHIQPAGIRALDKSTLGEIRGLVKDGSGNPLAGANVAATLPSAPSTPITATVSTGTASFNYDLFVAGNASYDLTATFVSPTSGATLTTSTAMPIAVTPGNVASAPDLVLQ